MYRTVKITDKAAASSGYIINIFFEFWYIFLLLKDGLLNINICTGHSDLYENGSSGDTTEDIMFDIQNSRKPEQERHCSSSIDQDRDDHALWCNSSRYYSSPLLPSWSKC